MRIRSLVAVFLLALLSFPVIADDQTSEARFARLRAQADVQAAKGVVAAVLVFNGARLDVLSYSFGASNSGSFSNEGGAGVGKVNFQDLSIARYVGTGSQELFRAV